MRNRTLNLVALVVIIMSLATGPSAHEHVCSHHHQNNKDLYVSCLTTSECEQDGNSGVCKTEQGTAVVWCRCTADGGEDDTEPGKGCNAAAIWYFDDQGEGIPTANTNIIYLAASDPFNYVSTTFGGSVVGPEFGPESNALEGTITLFYGSFTDPTNVPVTVEDVSISFTEVAGEGSNFFELPDGEFQYLKYDSTTGKIDSLDGTGIKLWLSNNSGSELPVVVNLQGTIDPSGGLDGYAQIAVQIAIFYDGLESGATDDWDVTVP